MKAMVMTKFGPPDMLQFQEVAKPVPKDNEVLILYWLLRISVRKSIACRNSIRYFVGRCHSLWRSRSCEANTFALWHTFLKPEIQLAMWGQEECERW